MCMSGKAAHVKDEGKLSLQVRMYQMTASWDMQELDTEQRRDLLQHWQISGAYLGYDIWGECHHTACGRMRSH